MDEIKIHVKSMNTGAKWKRSFWDLQHVIAAYLFWCIEFGSSRNQNVSYAVSAWTGHNKMFKERQHPRPVEIRKCEHWLGVAISNSDPPHGTLHHTTKFHIVRWFPHIFQHGSSSRSKAISKFRGHANITRAKAFYIAICFTILCITLPNFMPIAQIPK